MEPYSGLLFTYLVTVSLGSTDQVYIVQIEHILKQVSSHSEIITVKSIIHTKLLAFVIYEQLLLSCLFFPPFKGDFLVDRFNSVAFAVSQVNNALDLIFLLIIFFGQFTTMIQVAKMVQYQILACPIHRLRTHPWQ